MAGAGPTRFHQISADTKNRVSNTRGAVITTPQQMGMQVLQLMTGGPTVVVTQPVVTISEPQTQCALCMSVLGSIFCCFVCGITGILVSWKARLYVLENKFEHARHSLVIVWILFAFTLLFGLITWLMVTFFLVFRLKYVFGYANCDSYKCYY